MDWDTDKTRNIEFGQSKAEFFGRTLRGVAKILDAFYSKPVSVNIMWIYDLFCNRRDTGALRS